MTPATIELAPRHHLGGTAYRHMGRGEAVVLIHGVGLNADAWEPQIAQLSQGYRVIAVDMPGHGASQLPDGPLDLSHFVQLLADLLDGLGIASANVIGHSMGGLVAIGFALAHPARTLRLGVLNSVYQRSPEQRRAVMARAAELNSTGSSGSAAGALARWFGAPSENPALSAQVGAWLAGVNAKAYATAYDIFARSDDAFVGKLNALSMPALFATGTGDQNSTPAMANVMAAAAPHGTAAILYGARHMMNLTHPEATNSLLADLLAQPAKLDPKQLRAAFGTFMTGVTVVTTRAEDGTLRGFTANSFSSVSLDPPLLLICLAKSAASCSTFEAAQHFAVNILSENQKDVSGIFASKRADKFEATEWTVSASGNALMTGAVAWFDCRRQQTVDAGDHIILIGQVQSFAHNDQSPLGYARGGYFTLGLEQSVVNAVSHAGRTEVGAILECDGALVVQPGTAPGSLALPRVGQEGAPGSASGLLESLSAKGLSTTLGFLYAVFENPEARTHSIYYRGQAERQGGTPPLTVSFDAMPWDRFEDPAIIAMLRRYCTERVQGRYRIYAGDHRSGETRELQD